MKQYTQKYKFPKSKRNLLMTEFSDFTIHHGKCDCCESRLVLVIHIHESKTVDNILKSDYRICEGCLKKLFIFAKRNGVGMIKR